MTEAVKRLSAGVQQGESFEEVLVEDLTRTRLVQYAGASGDYNPIHTDEPFVKEVAGYPTVFAHGMLTMGLAGGTLTRLFGAGNVKKYSVRFTGQVWPGDTLKVKAQVTGIETHDGKEVVSLALSVFNQSDQQVLAGTASGSV